MLKKFLNGLVFGTGFGIAFVIVWSVGVSYLLPKALETSHKEPMFENPQSAEVAKPDPSLVPKSSREFSFFKDSENRMKIPENGGILSMSPTTTTEDAERPNTYQLWLTHTELWQIRTVGEKTEIEKLPYPEGASVKTLDSLMHKNLGFSARQSTMTISDIEINKLKSSGESWRDETLNGKLKITVEGVVFILPNPYKT
jgi:hypothetical protein